MGRVPGAVGVSVETVGLGFYFEDLPVGRRFRTIGRTVTEADITSFVNCTGMVEVLFTNTEFLREESDIKQRLAPAALSYCFAEGLLVQATMQHTGFAFLGMELTIENPVFAGDTIHVECEVIEARRSKSRPNRGLVHRDSRVRPCWRSRAVARGPSRQSLGASPARDRRRRTWSVARWSWSSPCACRARRNCVPWCLLRAVVLEWPRASKRQSSGRRAARARDPAGEPAVARLGCSTSTA